MDVPANNNITLRNSMRFVAFLTALRDGQNVQDREINFQNAEPLNLRGPVQPKGLTWPVETFCMNQA